MIPMHAYEGLRVLVVEDEALVSLLIEDMLMERGCVVIGPAANVRRALELLDREEVDAALLDVNLGSETCWPVADALSARHIPFAFATGYGREGVAPAHVHVPVLEKPFEAHGLDAILHRLADGERRFRG